MKINASHTVSVFDDHPMITDGIRLLLADSEHFEMIAVAHSWKQLISTLRAQLPDILILDLNIKGENIIGRVSSLKDQFPKLKILVFSSYNTPSIVKKALAEEINGYLLKDTTQQELIDALTTIAKGATYIGKRVATPKQKNNADFLKINIEEPFTKKNKLSAREIEIVQLLTKGLDSQRMADHLSISLHTVQSHRKNIMKKLNLHSAAEIVRFAFENKLV